MMGKISKTLRFEILARDGFRCGYCGAGADVAVLHVDHRNPSAKGGNDDRENLVTACADCNSGKSDRVLIPTRWGFDLTKDRGPERAARARKGGKIGTPAVDPNRHVLNTGEIDSLDEIDEDCQLALVWCDSHKKFEWHNLPRELIGHTSELVRVTRPGWKGAI